LAVLDGLLADAALQCRHALSAAARPRPQPQLSRDAQRPAPGGRLHPVAGGTGLDGARAVELLAARAPHARSARRGGIQWRVLGVAGRRAPLRRRDAGGVDDVLRAAGAERRLAHRLQSAGHAQAQHRRLCRAGSGAARGRPAADLLLIRNHFTSERADPAMKRSRRRIVLPTGAGLWILLGALGLHPATALAQAPKVVVLDRIVAVVNREVITQGDLESRVRMAEL